MVHSSYLASRSPPIPQTNCNSVNYGLSPGLAQVKKTTDFKIFGFSELIHPQIRSTWMADMSSCTIPNIKSNMANLISMFVTDFFLLVIMLVGLFRLRCRVAGRFALAPFLWKQVRCQPFLDCRSFLLDVISIQKGLIWLLLTTVAELPPLVCLAGFLRHHLANHFFASQVFVSLDLNGIPFPSNPETKNVDPPVKFRAIRYSMSLFVMIATSGGANKFLMRACNTDVLDAIPGDNVNRRNTDVPLPRGLCLCYRSVCHSPFQSHSALTMMGVAVV